MTEPHFYFAFQNHAIPPPNTTILHRHTATPRYTITSRNSARPYPHVTEQHSALPLPDDASPPCTLASPCLPLLRFTSTARHVTGPDFTPPALHT